jgi:hypothetical protein
MYNGTLIEDLIATVERVETSVDLDPEQRGKIACAYALAQNEIANLNWVRYDSVEVA